MIVGRETRLFFDASCLFASARSATGGSFYLLTLCRENYLQIATTLDAIEEAERNLVAKGAPADYLTFREVIAASPFALIARPTDAEVARYTEIVFEDDHIVAAALAGQVDALITLDRRLFQRIAVAGIPLPAMTPGGFIKGHLPAHPEFRVPRPEHDA
ncbi:MAG: PIN domain-containing protein [Dehalococcoidia bacterium]